LCRNESMPEMHADFTAMLKNRKDNIAGASEALS
jgi:hypothetical protein